MQSVEGEDSVNTQLMELLEKMRVMLLRASQSGRNIILYKCRNWSTEKANKINLHTDHPLVGHFTLSFSSDFLN